MQDSRSPSHPAPSHPASHPSHPHSDEACRCDGGAAAPGKALRGVAGLIDALPIAIFTTGPDHKIRRMNAAAAEILGLDRGEVLGRACDEVLDCATCSSECSAQTARATGEVSRDFATELHPGTSPSLAVRIDAVPLDDGEVAVILREASPLTPPSTDARMREALRRAAGNVTRAAALLGVHRTTLWRWMENGGVDRADYYPH